MAGSSVQKASVRVQLPPHVGGGRGDHLGVGGAVVQLQGQHPVLLLVLHHQLLPPSLWPPLPPSHPSAGQAMFSSRVGSKEKLREHHCERGRGKEEEQR